MARRPLLVVVAACVAVVLGSLAGAPATAAGSGRPARARRPTGWSRRTASRSCAAPAPTDRRPPAISVEVVHRGGGAAVVAEVCVEGTGPYPFAVDTGSSESVVSGTLARRLRLPRVGQPAEAAGIGCKVRVVPDEVASWSLGGVALRRQTVLAASVPSLGRRHPLDGVIGSDVLSRFGSIRIDYRTGTVSFGGAESASPTPKGVVEGPSSASVRGQLPAGVRVASALEVVSENGAVAAYAPVRLHGAAPEPFLVDTGARITSVSPLLVRSLSLRPAGGHVHVAAFGCPATLSEVSTGPWSLASASLPGQLVAELPASGVREAGLLGSDVLARYGVAVVDYRRGLLFLGVG